MTIFVHSGAPERGEVPLRQRRPRAAAVTEFDAALTTLGIRQRSAAQWFRTSERNIRRWKSGTRRTPPGVMVTVRLMMAGKVGPADVELAAASISAQPNGHAKPRPPISRLVEPAPVPATLALALADPGSTAAEKVYALAPEACRWVYGDPQRPDFCFCGNPAAQPPYCKQHREMAYLARSLSEARPGFRCSPGLSLLAR